MSDGLIIILIIMLAAVSITIGVLDEREQTKKEQIIMELIRKCNE